MLIRRTLHVYVGPRSGAEVDRSGESRAGCRPSGVGDTLASWRSRSSRAISPPKTSTPSSTPPTARCGVAVASMELSTLPVGEQDCRKRFPAGLSTGDAGWTTAGLMPARWIIHVVGPNYNRGERDRSLLTSCYERALAVADDLGARTVAFPLISAGSYGWPKTDAIDAAMEVLRSAETQVFEARMVAFASSSYMAIQEAIRRG